MSHGLRLDDDYYDLDPKEVLSQYSVEWIALRKSFDEVKGKIAEVQAVLAELDRKLENKKITEDEHISQYKEHWHMSTELVQVKREVEARLYQIQREIRKANKQLKLQEEERLKRERLETEKSNAMIEWMGLKQGFDLISQKRSEINAETDKLELKRRERKISEEDYRKMRLVHISELAQLRSLEGDVKKRLGELLEIIRR